MNGEITLNNRDLNIRDLRGAMKHLNITFVVLDVGKPTMTKEGHRVRTCKVADKTGSVNISAWDAYGDSMQPGDICKLTKGYAQFWKGCLTLYTGKSGEIWKLSEFCFPFAELPNMSEPNPDILAKMAEQAQGGIKRPQPPTSDGPEVHRVRPGGAPPPHRAEGPPSMHVKPQRPPIQHRPPMMNQGPPRAGVS